MPRNRRPLTDPSLPPPPRADGEHFLPLPQLRELATSFTAPSWATHVAVRYDGSRVEPACWDSLSRSFLDEDPAPLKKGDWAGAFKRAYWAFFPVDDLTGLAA